MKKIFLFLQGIFLQRSSSEDGDPQGWGELPAPSRPTPTPLAGGGGSSKSPFSRRCKVLFDLVGNHPINELFCVPGKTKAPSLRGERPCSTGCCSELIPLQRSSVLG